MIGLTRFAAGRIARTRFARIAAFWLLAALGAADAYAAVAPCRRGLQEFWMVNSRFAPTSRRLDCGIGQLRYSQRIDAGAFATRTRDQFLTGVDASLPTLILVHGNSLDYGQAIEGADRLAQAIGPRGPAYRLVLWSWPAEHIRGLRIRRNVRIKADLSDAQGYYLAWLIDRLDPRVRLSLVGHSFGARTISAALTGLARGQVAGQTLPRRLHPGRRPMQAALIAPAMDNTLLLPGGRHGPALSQVDRMLITVNPRDRTLRRFARMVRSRTAPLGITGLPRKSELGDQRFKVCETVLTPWMGGAHAWRRHMISPDVMARLRPFLVYNHVPAPPNVAAHLDTVDKILALGCVSKHFLLESRRGPIPGFCARETHGVIVGTPPSSGPRPAHALASPPATGLWSRRQAVSSRSLGRTA